MEYFETIQKNNSGSQKIFSISEYIDLVNRGLKEFSAKIIGEVGKVAIYPSGHVYFSLRDEEDQSVISCIIWKSRYRIYGVELKEGSKIIATGCPSVYKQTGRFSFIAETIELTGEGVLKKEYEKLKKKLTDQGIFEKSRKRAIPKYAQKIGIITSKQGAVLGDFLSNIGKHNFKLKLIHSGVEGQAAIPSLLSAIKSFKKQDIEVLVIMRGGGSFESLQAFNNELLVREVANFPAPVIAAIGHDKDTPLVSLAADLEVSTPSMAAMALSESWKRAILFLERYERNIINLYGKRLSETNNFLNEFVYKIKEKFSAILGRYKEMETKLKTFLFKIYNALLLQRKDINSISRLIIKNFSANLDNLQCQVGDISFCGGFERRIAVKKKDITDYSKSIIKDFVFNIEKVKSAIKNEERVIVSRSPETQLRVGYSIARQNKKLIRSIKNVNIENEMDVQVSDGLIQSKIKNISKI